MQHTKIMGIILVLLLIIVIPVFAQDGNGLDPETQTAVSAIEDQVAEIRELNPAEDIERILVLEDELATLVQEDLQENYPLEDAQVDVLWYCSLGFMACDVDLYALNEALLTEQVAGFYDIETDEMYVLSAGGGLDALAILLYSHEYTHALQDANFDLEILLDEERFENEPDYALATLALIEGDAQLMTLLYTEWLLRENPLMAGELLLQISSISDAEFQNSPLIMQSELLFPYEEGMIFIQSIYEDNGWRLVDAIYERPPLSTEQILHPDLYLLYEEPQQVDLANLDGYFDNPTEWELMDDHTVGEFYLREHLGLTQSSELASTAAAGWGGDHFRLYANADDQTIVTWKQVWDTNEDMFDFYNTYSSHAAAWLGAPVIIVDDVVNCWEGVSRSVCVGLLDDATYITIAPDQITANAVMQYIVQTSAG